MMTGYRKRDYAYGTAMLTLRTAVGLTQDGLAKHLGVSRRAVAEWEAGNSHPKAEHLKELIALGLKSQAWTPGSEVKEIRAFWKAAHQKSFIDEHWLSTVLSERSSPDLPRLPRPVEVSTETGPVKPLPALAPRVDWGDALVVPTFYGREEEQAELSQWIVQRRCHVVCVLGMGGIGKSALTVSAMYQLSGHFEVVIFRSLRDAPSCDELLNDCLQVLSPVETLPDRKGGAPVSTEQRISFLLSLLRTHRTLLVLDNLECLLEAGDSQGHFRPGFESYGKLLRRVAETTHQSCLLITSREKLPELRPLEGEHSTVYSMRLAGLSVAACQQMFAEKELFGTQAEREQLIAMYSGNPLALKIVVHTIIDLFGGQIGPFLASGLVAFGSITDLLDEQFARLSALEQTVLHWLAIMREPVTLDELWQVWASPLQRGQLFDAIDGLYQHSLIERGKRGGSFTLQSVVLEYMTVMLIAEASNEIKLRRLHRLIQHGLSLAKSHEYVRQAQERLLLSPLLTELGSIYRSRAHAAGIPPVEAHLLSLLDELRGGADSAQGYGPANLIALLRLLRGNLNGLDLSQLRIRSTYLQGIQMQDTKLCKATLRDTVLTGAVKATWAVAISRDGSRWAAGSLQGKVCVWEGVRFQTLRLAWQAHIEAVWTLAWSPDGRTLATGGYDTVKLWDVKSGALLWVSMQDYPRMLAFSSDGSRLASGGGDATVRIFDSASGTALETLTHASPVFAVAFSPDGRLLVSGCLDGEIRLWKRGKTELSTTTLILSVRTSWVADLAFAPDGTTLVSAHWDRTIKLWEASTLRLLDTLSELQARHLAWSPDGRILACCSPGEVIWLWDVSAGRMRSALRGHIGDVNRLAFAPGSHHLISGGADGTLRVWDGESGRCLHVIAGYAVSLCDVSWSPDSTHLVSGSSDTLVTLWDVNTATPVQVLRGHSWIVLGVGWSPDGRLVASGGYDTTIRLWDVRSGDCVHTFENPSVVLLSLAWSPDGSKIACGAHQRGVRVWDVTTRSLHTVCQPDHTMFIGIAWSPDGTRLAASSDDGNVYVWEASDGRLLECLQGHHSSVNRVAWSPDGKWLASGCKEELFVWDVQSGERLPTMASHPGVVHALAWAPNENLLVSAGSEGLLRWWNVATGECVSVQEGHHGMIRALRVSPNGRRLASSGDDGAIKIWDLASFAHVRTLRCDRPYERLNITGIRGLNEAEIASLQALGAIEEEARL